MTTTTTGGAYYRLAPHDFNVWRTLRGAARPGDVIDVELTPPWVGPEQIEQSRWFAELTAALDDGIELHSPTSGNLRHGAAILRELTTAIAAVEAHIADRESWAAKEAAEARASLKAEYKQGYEDGFEAAGLAKQAAEARELARTRQRAKRERDAAEIAERDARARKDPSSPAYVQA